MSAMHTVVNINEKGLMGLNFIRKNHDQFAEKGSQEFLFYY